MVLAPFFGILMHFSTREYLKIITEEWFLVSMPNEDFRKITYDIPTDSLTEPEILT